MSERSPDEDDAITKGLAWAGLRESQRGLVRAYLHRDPYEWRNCCGSSCDPCVLRIGHAVSKAREELGLGQFPARE